MCEIEALVDSFSVRGRTIVAFSGGVDSTLVALAAVKAMGKDAKAVMFNNDSIPKREIEEAKKAAQEVGIELEIVDMDLYSNSEITSNRIDRCGTCKNILMSELLKIAAFKGFDTVADGANSDDTKDYRPGLAASDKLGIWHPLMEAGIGKEQARKILKENLISVYDKPSTTCLMTRIPYGEKVTADKLKIIERTEEKVRTFGFHDIRLRLFETGGGDLLGVLEVDDPRKAMDNWTAIKDIPKGIRIVLDPLGYRQGSMNKTPFLP